MMIATTTTGHSYLFLFFSCAEVIEEVYKHSTQLPIDWLELNLHVRHDGRHCFVITDFNGYQSRFVCKTCHSTFKKAAGRNRHERLCKSRTGYTYPQDTMVRPSTSIWDKLRERNISLPKKAGRDPFLTYDLESALEKIEEDPGPLNADGSRENEDEPIWLRKTRFTQKHKAISCAIYGEIYDPSLPGPPADYEPDYLEYGDDVNQLVEAMLDTLNTYSAWAYEAKKKKYRKVYRQLEKRTQWAIQNMDFAQSESEMNRAQCILDRAVSLEKEFDAHCRQLIVAGFNSGE